MNLLLPLLAFCSILVLHFCVSKVDCKLNDYELRED